MRLAESACGGCPWQPVQSDNNTLAAQAASPSPPLYSQGVEGDPYLSIKVVLNRPHMPTACKPKFCLSLSEYV